MVLNAKQQRFADEFLVDFNATQAAIRVGYSAKTAGPQASRLLTNVSIREYIEKQKALLAEKNLSLRDRVVREYQRIAFADVRKLHDDNGNLKHILDLDDDTAAAIGGVEVVVERTARKGRSDDTGDQESVEEVCRTHKIKMVDKKGALDSLGKHLGLFNGNASATTDSMEFVDTPQNRLALAIKLAFILSNGVALKESGTVIDNPAQGDIQPK